MSLHFDVPEECKFKSVTFPESAFLNYQNCEQKVDKFWKMYACAFSWVATTRKGGIGTNPGERAGIPGQQADEKDWEARSRHTVQTSHLGTGDDSL